MSIPRVRDTRVEDPTDPSGAQGTVVSPTSDGDMTWEEASRRNAQCAAFARTHWLGPRRRLADLHDPLEPVGRDTGLTLDAASVWERRGRPAGVVRGLAR